MACNHQAGSVAGQVASYNLLIYHLLRSTLHCQASLPEELFSFLTFGVILDLGCCPWYGRDVFLSLHSLPMAYIIQHIYLPFFRGWFSHAAPHAVVLFVDLVLVG